MRDTVLWARALAIAALDLFCTWFFMGLGIALGLKAALAIFSYFA